MVPSGDANCSCWLSSCGAKGVQIILNLRKSRPNALNELFTRLCRTNASRRPDKQAKVKALLELSNGLAQCGLRDPQFRSGLCETSLGCDRQKSDQIVHVALKHSSAPHMLVDIHKYSL
jgi:hypothetical protein